MNGAIPPGVEVCAYRIIQEALSNARRHAAGSGVAVSVARDGDVLRLAVRNSRGKSASPDDIGERPGLGFVGMRERVALLGGSLSTGPIDRGGFLVEACLPLRDMPSVTQARTFEYRGEPSDKTLEEHA